ncbi:MAG: hypothetical protein ACYC49_09380 [Ignavibacteriaceae bacterium]
MEPYFDICSTESSLRHFLQKLGEFGELDKYILLFIQDGLKQRIIRRPSKAPYGEHGKDITAVENEIDKTFCSYVLKEGNLENHLDGQFGIINQMEEAMSIEL